MGKLIFFLVSFFVGTCASKNSNLNSQSSVAAGQYFIYMVSDNWGEVDSENVQAVAISAASVLMRHFPYKKLNPILLANHDDSPITLNKRGDQDEYLIFVNINGRRWAQLSYQFSHEFCHVLSNYKNESGKNQWFEEALCEALSLFALEEMGKKWKYDPPYQNWKGYASSIQKYLDNMLSEEHRAIKNRNELVVWYNENKLSLRTNPHLRNKNEVIGTAIFRLIQADEFNIASVQFINLGLPDESKELPRYIGEWYENTPGEYKNSVKKIAELFGISI